MSFCSNRYFVSWEQIISCRLKFSSAFGSFVHVCCNSVYIIVVIAQCFELWGEQLSLSSLDLKRKRLRWFGLVQIQLILATAATIMLNFKLDLDFCGKPTPYLE